MFSRAFHWSRVFRWCYTALVSGCIFSRACHQLRTFFSALVDSYNMKVKNDHRSKFSNLSNWKEEAWKNQGFNGIRTRDLRDTGAMLTGHGFESRWSPDFFRLLLSNCLNWKIYCDDHSSLWSTTAVQIYDLFHIYFTSVITCFVCVVSVHCTVPLWSHSEPDAVWNSIHWATCKLVLKFCPNCNVDAKKMMDFIFFLL